MRHRKNKIKLNRTTAHRKNLLKNLVKNLLANESIKTTLTKAKAARKLADKVINLSKNENLANKRTVYSILQDHSLTSRVFKEIGPKFKDRAGGYTKIISLNNRKGDGAPMALLSLTELKAKPKTKPKTKRKTKEEKIQKKESKEPIKKEKAEKKKEIKKEKPPKKKEKKTGFLGNLRKYLGKDRGSR